MVARQNKKSLWYMSQIPNCLSKQIYQPSIHGASAWNSCGTGSFLVQPAELLRSAPKNANEEEKS